MSDSGEGQAGPSEESLRRAVIVVDSWELAENESMRDPHRETMIQKIALATDVALRASEAALAATEKTAREVQDHLRRLIPERDALLEALAEKDARVKFLEERWEASDTHKAITEALDRQTAAEESLATMTKERDEAKARFSSLTQELRGTLRAHGCWINTQDREGAALIQSVGMALAARAEATKAEDVVSAAREVCKVAEHDARTLAKPAAERAVLVTLESMIGLTASIEAIDLAAIRAPQPPEPEKDLRTCLVAEVEGHCEVHGTTRLVAPSSPPPPSEEPR